MVYSRPVAVPPIRVRWIDRVVGVTIGAGATAWLLRGDPEAVAVRDEGPPAGVGIDPVAIAGEQAPDAPSRKVMTAGAGVVAPTDAAAPVSSDPTDDAAIAAPHVAMPVDVPTAGLDVQPSATPAADPADAPALPLPRMPGDTRLSGSSRFDATGPAWILKAAYRMHVREHHVIGFYRKALADQGLTVTQSEDPPGLDGSIKTYLHGRSARVHAQVGILPRTGELETRVWILWRTRA